MPNHRGTLSPFRGIKDTQQGDKQNHQLFHQRRQPEGHIALKERPARFVEMPRVGTQVDFQGFRRGKLTGLCNTPAWNGSGKRLRAINIEEPGEGLPARSDWSWWQADWCHGQGYFYQGRLRRGNTPFAKGGEDGHIGVGAGEIGQVDAGGGDKFVHDG